MEYQEEKFEEYRERRIFSFFPFIIVDDFHWTGKWFQFVKIKEQKIRTRYEEFDDGWTYSFYWGRWNLSWKFIEFIK